MPVPPAAGLQVAHVSIVAAERKMAACVLQIGGLLALD